MEVVVWFVVTYGGLCWDLNFLDGRFCRIFGRISLKVGPAGSYPGFGAIPGSGPVIDAWKHCEFLCRNYILNGLDDTLYDVYWSYTTAKELWNSLEKKYKVDDAGSKKFIIGKFLNYKMVDSKTVVSQVDELQVIIHELHAEGMVINESFQVGSVIEKLPPSWKDFKVHLKHKKSEMTMEDLVLKLRVQEDHLKSEKQPDGSVIEAKANMVEGETSKPKFKGQKFKGNKHDVKYATKTKNFNKIKGSCWVCGKPGHKA
ncbi:uncharacterized protein LOC121050607 [Rosa chinensis]|uniref:uncharacterized protein LOC121050607 n=1 Tax=Rosa chinensis TaxID=74649 RepID=UPI001AD8F512|nr:uncharacterized protein LOC121050607 [Rosa chinensis]